MDKMNPERAKHLEQAMRSAKPEKASKAAGTAPSAEASHSTGSTLSRRQFVIGAAATATAAGAASIALGASPGKVKAAEALSQTPELGGQWVRTTCSPNCTGACGMEAWVEDGEVRMIRQAADYPYEHYNPRGCLKGLSLNTMLHGPDRLTRPLIRNADGEQVEADWDTALDTAADKLRDIAEKYGPNSIGVIYQVQGTGHIQKGALVRIANTFGWSVIGGYELNGDLPMFWPETFGCQSEELESYCWEDSKLTLIFGSNIMVTRIPDAQFLTYSQENGGKVIYFDPNYSASAERADEWVRIAPDSDGAFALGMAKTIIDEDLYDRHFMQTYTDSPLLIDTATGKRILADDVAGLTVAANIPDYRSSFAAFDESTGAFAATTPLELPDNSFALLGEYDVPLKDGTTVKAKTGFQLLCDRLEDYTAEDVEGICHIDADTIKRIAREAATVKPMHIIFGGGTQQWYHGDLKGRACALVACLTGNIGQLGGGISTYVGQYKTRFNTASWMVPEGSIKASCPFHYWVNGPTPQMKAVYPKDGFKALVVGWGNPLEQHNVANWLRDAIDTGDIECLVCLDFQKTLTVAKSTVAFPSASWYEKTELTTTPLHPYVQLQQRIVDPPGEAREEIWTFTELANRIDPSKADIWPRFAPEDSEKRADEVLALLLEKGGPTIDHLTPEELRKGPGKLAHSNPGEKRIPFWEQINERIPFPTVSRPNALDVTSKFVRSGRIEFYRDEDIFLDLDEQLPRYKPPFEDTEYKEDPEARELYPLGYTTRNSAFRVHATYVNNPFMLEMQDNTPKVWLNPDTAAERGLKNGDWVEVYNSRGAVQGQLIEDPGVWPTQCIFDQGWWSAYDNGTSYNSLIWPWINPTNEVYYLVSVWSPNMAWNETACNVRLCNGGVPEIKKETGKSIMGNGDGGVDPVEYGKEA